MKRTITTLAILLGATAIASATDLPSKTKAPVAPTATESQYYVGGNIGGNLDSNRVYSAGAVAGVNVLPFFAVEGSYDLTRPDAKVSHKWNYGNQVALNAVPQIKVPGTDVTVYALAGAGYKWNTQAADFSVYNVGGGLKYAFTKSLEIDGRYRRIDAIESKYRTNSSAEDRATVGVNVKF